MTIKVLVLSGEGINCETETAYAFEQAGAKSTIIHLNDFLELDSLDDFDILVFPGGFSFGDEIRSGKIVSELIKLHQYEAIKRFIQQKKPVLGICNGFQILAQLGAFNNFKNRTFTLSENIQGKFIDKWVELEILPRHSLWLKEISTKLYMPIRHKEGRIVGTIPEGQMLLKYSTDVNGSFSCIAGLSNEQGNVLGLMPHPEAAIHSFLLPQHKEKAVLNLKIFQNAVQYSKILNKNK